MKATVGRAGYRVISSIMARSALTLPKNCSYRVWNSLSPLLRNFGNLRDGHAWDYSWVDDPEIVSQVVAEMEMFETES
jgi:hypothetical protein